MEKLIVQKPFEHNGVHYHQGMEFRPRNDKDAEDRERRGDVTRKVFVKRGESAAPRPAPRKLEVRTGEQKLAEETIEKAQAPVAEPAETAAPPEEKQEEDKDDDEKPARRGRRRTLSAKKDD